MKPDFIIAGASRSGTTTLCKYLNDLDNVFIPDKKELRYFDRDEVYYNDKVEYRSFFDNTNVDVVGECSPPYFYKLKYCSELPARRIFEYSPDTKIIFTLRRPTYRAYSQYCKKVCEGKERCSSLKEAVEEELAGVRTFSDSMNCYLWQNVYIKHINRFKTLFGSHNILVLFFENWINNPEHLSRLHSFLGIKEGVNTIEIGHHNSLGYPVSRRLNTAVNALVRRDTTLGGIKNNLFAKAAVFFNRKLNRRKKPRLEASTEAMLRDYFERPNRTLAREIDAEDRMPWL
jgi:hypothetical protein